MWLRGWLSNLGAGKQSSENNFPYFKMMILHILNQAKLDFNRAFYFPKHVFDTNYNF